MRAFFSLQCNARHQASPSVPTRSFCESIFFVLLEALGGSERRVVRIVGMVGLTLDETRSALMCFFKKFRVYVYGVCVSVGLGFAFRV